jgi:hypothetical protein
LLGGKSVSTFTISFLEALMELCMVQIFAGLITYLLMAIYCAEEHGEWVNMKRVRELRNTIQNELRASQMQATNSNRQNPKKRKRKRLNARS